jgi:hypothetical protein
MFTLDVKYEVQYKWLIVFGEPESTLFNTVDQGL